MAAVELVLGAMPREGAPESHRAAGAWCFCGREECFPNWDEKFQFAPEPLTDAALARTASRAAQALVMRELMGVAKSLCAGAGKFPAVYWHTLLGPFMIEAVSQIVERALRVQAMIRQWGAEPLQVALLPEACVFPFADEHDFTLRGSLGLEFNHWLLSRLLEGQMPAAWRAHYLEPYVLPQLPAAQKGFLDKIKGFLLDAANALPFPKLKGMGLGDALRLSWRLREPCKGRYEPWDPGQYADFANDLAQIPLPAGAGKLLEAMVPESLKKLRYEPLKSKAARPRLRIAPTAVAEDVRLRQHLARWRAAGNLLAHCQHGGIYGHAAAPCAAALTEYDADVFFTWGWKSQGKARGNFAPLPSPPLSALPKYQGGGDKLILAGTEMAAFGRRLDSHPSPLQYAAYRRSKKTFLEHLPADVRARTAYRPYFPLPGTLADGEWLLPQFPEVSLCQGPLMPQLLRCRLLVLDHPGTTMLEALAADIPFIVYWDKDAWPWAPEAAQALEQLAACGIWHETPEGAAAQAALVWDDVAHWLDSPEIRQGRDAFAARYALHDGNWRNIWNKALEKL